VLAVVSNEENVENSVSSNGSEEVREICRILVVSALVPYDYYLDLRGWYGKKGRRG
jgi:hypothetical protein